MKRSDSTLPQNLGPQFLLRSLADAVGRIDGVVSISLVGSIADGADLRTVSDIDTVVICEQLREPIFRACTDAVQTLPGNKLGGAGKSILVNTTFGPLKFDAPEHLVVHLMIYDRAGHRRHVLQSPFTCLDWERSKLRFGPALREIYPVLGICPHDFIDARRGLDNYLADLEAGSISYREYCFLDNHVSEEIRRWNLDERLRAEYAYHIMKMLTSNYAKLVDGANRSFDPAGDLLVAWKEFLPPCAAYVPLFESLHAAKFFNRPGVPRNLVAEVRRFLAVFYDFLKMTWDDAPRLTWMRHARTAANDGTFFGQGRNPGIINESLPALKGHVDCVYASRLRRSQQTAQCLVPDHDVIVRGELDEQDYGDAEGLHYEQLRNKFPHLVQAWSRGEDPAFPTGESSTEVATRVTRFLKSVSTGTRAHGLVVSHNGTTRCMLGSLLNLPKHTWHRLQVDHLEPFTLRFAHGRWFLDLLPRQREYLTDHWKGSV